jgi:hypothetical protein
VADGDEHFRIGVQHGLDDQPVYCWQDAWHQDRYDAGYSVGQFQRITQDYHQRHGTRMAESELLAVFDAMMKRRGLVRTR